VFCPVFSALYTLAVIYRRDLRELLAWYGVDLNNMAADLGMIAPPRSQCLRGLVRTIVRAGADPHGSWL